MGSLDHFSINPLHVYWSSQSRVIQRLTYILQYYVWMFSVVLCWYILIVLSTHSFQNKNKSMLFAIGVYQNYNLCSIILLSWYAIQIDNACFISSNLIPRLRLRALQKYTRKPAYEILLFYLIALYSLSPWGTFSIYSHFWRCQCSKQLVHISLGSYCQHFTHLSLVPHIYNIYICENVFKTTRPCCYQWFRVSTRQVMLQNTVK